MWIFVAYQTLLMVHSRQIFEAPCLEDVDMAKCAVRASGVQACTREEGAGLSDAEENIGSGSGLH